MSNKESSNLNREVLLDYLTVFHKKIIENTDAAIPEEYRDKVRHYKLASLKIVGYVSTQFGVGWEYFENLPHNIEVIVGSKRIEDLIANTPNKYTNYRPTVTVDTDRSIVLSDSFLWNGPLRKVGVVGDLIFKNLSFRFGDEVKVVYYAELFFDRNRDLYSAEKAKERAEKEVLAASYDLIIANSKKQALEEYINTNKQKLVLILGSYSEKGMERLDEIAENLRSAGYEPVRLSDIKDNPYQNLRQKVTALGSLARFVIVDDTERSGHLNEIELCRINEWVTSIVRIDGKPSTAMSAGNSIFSSVISERSFSLGGISKVVAESIEWSENLVKELKIKMDTTYPWRN